MWAVLDPDERARARQFRRPRDSRRFVAARSLVRDGLSRHCCDVAPEGWHFRRAPGRRPELAATHETDVRFSVSRTDDLVAVIVTNGIECGIDAETIRPLADLDDLAGVVLADSERTSLARLSDARARLAAFFDSWTVKEAYGKAVGKGLDIPLRQIVVNRVGNRATLDGELDGGADDWDVSIQDISHNERLALVVRCPEDLALKAHVSWV